MVFRCLGITDSLQISGEGVRVSREDEFPGGVPAQRRFVTTQLDDNEAFIVSKSDVVSGRSDSDAPSTLKRVAESGLQPLRLAVPNLDDTVFPATDDEWEVEVEDGEREAACPSRA